MRLSVNSEFKRLLLLLMERTNFPDGVLALVFYSLKLPHVVKLEPLGVHLLLAHPCLPLEVDHLLSLVPFVGSHLKPLLNIFLFNLPLEQLLTLFDHDLLYLELILLDEPIFIVQLPAEISVTVACVFLPFLALFL